MSRLPQQFTMSPAQAMTLRMLALEAYQEQMFELRLTYEEAQCRIDELKKGNSPRRFLLGPPVALGPFNKPSPSIWLGPIKPLGETLGTREARFMSRVGSVSTLSPVSKNPAIKNHARSEHRDEGLLRYS